MRALELVQQVKACVEENWHGSDLWSQSEAMLEKIAAHLETCEACREAFDFQAYEEKTLIEFEARLGTTKLEDWVCCGVH